MRWILGGWGRLVLAALCGAACGDGTAGNLFPGDASVSVLPVLGGRGGRGGVAGPGGSGGSTSELDAGSGQGGSPSDATCSTAEECADGNPCTIEFCSFGACTSEPATPGAGCGSAADEECTHPDTCDGAGVCLANDEADGSACSAGACGAGACVPGEIPECAAAVVAELPFEASWRTVGGVDRYRASCDGDDTPDFAVVFSAPETAVYRFEAAGVVGDDDPEGDPGSELADSVLAIAAGSCAGADAQELGCNDDVNDTFDSRIDLRLEAGQTVTVYVNEFEEVVPGGGSGTIAIRRLSNDD